MYRPSLSGRRYSGLGAFSPTNTLTHLKHHLTTPGAGPPMFASPYGLMGMMGGMGGGLGMDPFGIMGMGGMGIGMGIGMGMGGMGRSRRSLCEMPYGYGYGGRGGSRFMDPYEIMYDDMYDDECLEDFDDIEDPLLFYIKMMGRQGRRGRRRLGGMGCF